MRKLPFLGIWLGIVALASDFPMAQIESLTHYEQPDVELVFPTSFTLDNNGFLYALDMGAKRLFVWDDKGKFVRSLGRAGEGPGEFALEDEFNHVVVTAEHIMVLDNRVRRVLYWTRDFNFSHTRHIKGFARVVNFQAFGDGFLLVSSSHKTGSIRLLVVDREFQAVQELASVSDSQHTKKPDGGWLYKPHADKLIMAANQSHIWFGNSNENWIRHLSATGEQLKEFKVPLQAEPLSELEKAYFKKQFAGWRTAKDEMQLPENEAFFDKLFPLGNHLAVVQSRYKTGIWKGFLLDPQSGKVKARFQHKLGEMGSMHHASNGKIILLSSDAEGEFHLSLGHFTLSGV